MSGVLHVSRRGEHVALIEIDNPPRNTLGREMRARLGTVLSDLDADLSVRAVILTGRGKAFCSGDDLREEYEALGGDAPRGENLRDFASLLEKVGALRPPVIAAINGWCVGGGVELALCCDLRIAANDARFVCAGVNVGLMASAYRLPRLIGEGPAKHMLLTGLPMEASRAEAFGLVTAVHEPESLVVAALELAERIASRAPLSVEASNRVADRARDLTPEEGTAAQVAELGKLLSSDDHREAVQAFLEKREPKFERN